MLLALNFVKIHIYNSILSIPLVFYFNKYGLMYISTIWYTKLSSNVLSLCYIIILMVVNKIKIFLPIFYYVFNIKIRGFIQEINLRNKWYVLSYLAQYV